MKGKRKMTRYRRSNNDLQQLVSYFRFNRGYYENYTKNFLIDPTFPSYIFFIFLFLFLKKKIISLVFEEEQRIETQEKRNKKKKKE